MKKKAFIVVGHANWGKSETLAKLTNGNRYTRHMKLSKISERMTAYVRRISNDDNEDSLRKFATNLGLRITQDYLIMTLCPNFSEGRHTEEILKSLGTKYDLHFFILKNNFFQTEIVTERQIKTLNMYGQIMVVSEHLEANNRASLLIRFIKNCL